MPIDQAFNDSIAYYDSWIQNALPNYDETFAVARASLPYPPQTRLNVLDLGAGTGLFSWLVLQQYPAANFVLYDVAAKMLDGARARFQNCPDQFQYVIDDYRHLMAEAEFDLVISSLSIHHLEDADKQDLFRCVYAALRPGGIFLNVDQIKGPTPALHEFYWTQWLKQVRQKGLPETQIQESIQRRQIYDREALLTEQLDWLAQAGFVEVDCLYKQYFVGVFYAVKPQQPTA